MFLAPPETAHEIAKWFFKRPSLWRLLSWHLSVIDERLHVKVGNLELPNPVGLAAGFDKNCEMWKSLFRIGFAYLTLGTVTLSSREGNPKPRMWRYPEKSLVNSMGLPNRGARENVGNLMQRPPNMEPVIVSVSGLNIEEFVECYRLMEPSADGIELNISTPNTVGVRIFQEPDMLTRLLKAINEARTSNKPIWVKIPPYFEDEGREKVHELVDVCAKAAVTGLTATNTKLVKEPRASIGTGGLSGPPIFNDTLRIVADIYDYTEGRIPINACGGISSGFDAWKAFEAGASSVQLYTALVYHGPGVVSRINRQILHLLAESKLDSLSDVIGTRHK
jgi:dihydroorotate dehydrogenase